MDEDGVMLRIAKDDAGPVVRLRVTGELDLDTAGQLADVVRDAVAGPGFERLEIDLGAVSFLDSSGLRVLVTGRTNAHSHGGTFAAVNVPPNIRRTMDITGLAEVLIGP